MKGKTDTASTQEKMMVPPLPVEQFQGASSGVGTEDDSSVVVPVDTDVALLGLTQGESQKAQDDIVGFELKSGEYKVGQVFDLGKRIAPADPAFTAGMPGQRVGYIPVPQFDAPSMIEAAIAPIRAEMEAKFQQLSDQILAVAAARTNGISAQLVGGMFDCPKCGMRIPGPSLTSQKGGFYEHPWGESNNSGKKCELIGKRFKAPIIFLEAITPLTPKAQ